VEEVLGFLRLNLFDVALLIAAQDLINAFWACQGDLSTILRLEFLCFCSCTQMLNCVIHLATRKHQIRLVTLGGHNSADCRRGLDIQHANAWALKFWL
jgi:hypothetical protein